MDNDSRNFANKDTTQRICDTNIDIGDGEGKNPVDFVEIGNLWHVCLLKRDKLIIFK